MLKVIAEDFMQPDAVEILMPMYEELVAATRREPLCISYDLFVDQKDPGHFVFIETWPDQAGRGKAEKFLITAAAQYKGGQLFIKRNIQGFQ